MQWLQRQRCFLWVNSWDRRALTLCPRPALRGELRTALALSTQLTVPSLFDRWPLRDGWGTAHSPLAGNEPPWQPPGGCSEGALAGLAATGDGLRVCSRGAKEPQVCACGPRQAPESHCAPRACDVRAVRAGVSFCPPTALISVRSELPSGARRPSGRTWLFRPHPRGQRSGKGPHPSWPQRRLRGAKPDPWLPLAPSPRTARQREPRRSPQTNQPRGTGATWTGTGGGRASVPSSASGLCSQRDVTPAPPRSLWLLRVQRQLLGLVGNGALILANVMSLS